MFSKLFRKSRAQDTANGGHGQTDRIFQVGKYWFFRTREDLEVGPFDSRRDAQYALLYFVEQADWPSQDQLKEFIEGCELNAGMTRLADS